MKNKITLFERTTKLSFKGKGTNMGIDYWTLKKEGTLEKKWKGHRNKDNRTPKLNIGYLIQFPEFVYVQNLNASETFRRF